MLTSYLGIVTQQLPWQNLLLFCFGPTFPHTDGMIQGLESDTIIAGFVFVDMWIYLIVIVIKV